MVPSSSLICEHLFPMLFRPLCVGFKMYIQVLVILKGKRNNNSLSNYINVKHFYFSFHIIISIYIKAREAYLNVFVLLLSVYMPYIANHSITLTFFLIRNVPVLHSRRKEENSRHKLLISILYITEYPFVSREGAITMKVST